MTIAEKTKLLSYINAKVEFLADAMGRETGRRFLSANRPLLARLLARDPRTLARAVFKSVDSELELMARPVIGETGIAAVSKRLEAQFGFGRIGVDRNLRVRRILNRERIRTSAELRLLLDLLAEDTSRDYSVSERGLMQQIVDQYEKRGAARRC